MRSRKLTARQVEVLDAITGLTKQQGFPPSLRELGRALGCSWTVARNHVDALAHKGLLTRGHRKTRAISVKPLPDYTPTVTSVEAILGT